MTAAIGVIVMKKVTTPPMVTHTVTRPIATVTIEPIGARSDQPREHSISVMLKLGASGDKAADHAHVTSVARRALGAYAPPEGEADPRRLRDVAVSRHAKAGVGTSVVVGVEASAVSQGRPSDQIIENMHDQLDELGYRISVREKRECAEPGCKVELFLDWNQLAEIPPGWHSNHICGAHNYRRCTKCKSLFMLNSVNAAGQAPSVHCEVCGQVLIEWGSSKVWTATLISKG